MGSSMHGSGAGSTRKHEVLVSIDALHHAGAGAGTGTGTGAAVSMAMLSGRPAGLSTYPELVPRPWDCLVPLVAHLQLEHGL